MMAPRSWRDGGTPSKWLTLHEDHVALGPFLKEEL
jgi:hypothetical protein